MSIIMTGWDWKKMTALQIALHFTGHDFYPVKISAKKTTGGLTRYGFKIIYEMCLVKIASVKNHILIIDRIVVFHLIPQIVKPYDPDQCFGSDACTF